MPASTLLDLAGRPHLGFLHERGDGWRAAPAFDLNPDPATGRPHLGTTIDLGDSATLALALHMAGQFRLDEQHARSCRARSPLPSTAGGRWLPPHRPSAARSPP